MSLLDAFVMEPFSVNQPLIDSLLLEPNSFEFYVAVRTDGKPGSGELWDPFDASTATLFDALMNSFPPNTTIHLAPGIYETAGHADGVAGGWQPKRGFRIVGAGIDITTIKLVNPAPTAGASYFAIGADDLAVIDEFEASDLTVDCNLANFASAATGAIKVHGTHVYFRRIRAIQFGSRTTSQRGVVLATAGAYPTNPEPFDCVVEDCIIDQPYPNSVRETACISVVGRERVSDGVMAYHRGCVVRNCFVDCQFVKNEVPIGAISRSGAVATVTTKQDHQRSDNQWVVIAGALLSSSSNPYNGSFKISLLAPPVANQFTYTMVSSPSADPTGDMAVDKYPSQVTGIQSVSVQSLGGNQYRVTVTTVGPHLRTLGDRVVVNKVTVSGVESTILNGNFPIFEIGNSNTDPGILKYDVTSTTDPGTPDASQPDAFVGVEFHGIVVAGGVGTILESNRILNVRCGVFSDVYSTKDLVIRDNHFSGVVRAVQFPLGGVSTNNGTRRAGTISAAGTTATFDTLTAHGFSVQQAVDILGATQGAYNGTFPIQTVTSPRLFTYVMGSSPSSPATGSPTFAALWQVGRVIVENNVVELLPSIQTNTDGHSCGFWLGGANHVAPYVFRQVVLRGNVVRHVGDVSDPTSATRAIELNSCEQAIVEDNVVKLDTDQPIQFIACGAMKFFNNQTPAGALIQGYNRTLTQFVNELTTDADLGLILAT